MEAKATRSTMKIVPPGKKKCVWMEAGVVSYKLCDNNYDCPTCQYDHAMQAKAEKSKLAATAQPSVPAADKVTATWVETMMMLPADRRKCRYMLTGEVGRKICPNAYDCGTCAFDQMMQEKLQAEVLPVTLERDASGFDLARDIYYHEGHTWARPEYGGRVRVGLDDFARRLIGQGCKVELPRIGQAVTQGALGFHLRRNGDMVGALAPVDGIVSHVNHRLVDQPELINASPYEDGWLFIVEPTKLRTNLKGLFYGEDAGAFMRQEKDRLFALANQDLQLAADGGETVEDVSRELKGPLWTKVLAAVLRS